MNVTVLGCGRWGTFLAWYAERLGHNVTLWGRPGSENLARLWADRMNEYLRLPESIEISDQLPDALSYAEFVLVSVSSQGLRALLRDVAKAGGSAKTQKFVLCMKGLELPAGNRLTRVFAEEMDSDYVAVWVGPGHVQAFVQGIPNCMLIDAQNATLQEDCARYLGSSLIRFYYGTDLLGTEIGAASKNVIGLAAGMLDGLDLTPLKGALMARAPREISKLIYTMGGLEQSAYGLAHLGDYEATLFSHHSHNRRFGEDFVRGRRFSKLAEGVYTAKALCALGRALNVEMPICECVNSILNEDGNPREVLDDLFRRPLKREFI